MSTTFSNAFAAARKAGKKNLCGMVRAIIQS